MWHEYCLWSVSYFYYSTIQKFSSILPNSNTSCCSLSKGSKYILAPVALSINPFVQHALFCSPHHGLHESFMASESVLRASLVASLVHSSQKGQKVSFITTSGQHYTPGPAVRALYHDFLYPSGEFHHLVLKCVFLVWNSEISCYYSDAQTPL